VPSWWRGAVRPRPRPPPFPTTSRSPGTAQPNPIARRAFTPRSAAQCLRSLAPSAGAMRDGLPGPARGCRSHGRGASRSSQRNVGRRATHRARSPPRTVKVARTIPSLNLDAPALRPALRPSGRTRRGISRSIAATAPVHPPASRSCRARRGISASPTASPRIPPPLPQVMPPRRGISAFVTPTLRSHPPRSVPPSA
jgi:hypothetical protein